jgi:ABC transporter fused permease/ATP-binding protein
MAARKKASDDTPKVKVTKDSLKKAFRLYGFLKPYKYKFIIGMLFLFLTSATALVFPMLMGKLVDAANEELIQNIDKIGITLLALFTAQAIFSYFRVALFVDVTENTLAALRNTTYQRLISLPMTFFVNRRVGELNSRLASDISLLQDTLTTTIAEFLRQFILIIGGIAFLSLTSVKLTLIMLSVVPLLAIIAVIFGRYIRKVSRSVQDKIADSNTIVEETLQGISNVKAFTNELFEIARYQKSTADIVQQALKGGKARGAFASFIILAIFGAIVFVIWYGVRMVNTGELSIGSMFQFVLYSVFVGASIGGIAELYASIQKAIGATERIFEIIDETAEDVVLAKQEMNLEKLHGNVVFESVQFAYPSRKEIEVLKNISFSANSGEQIAIVGPSGAGKSTLVSLLFRFYDPQNGAIIIDGKNIKDYPLTYLRSQMAVVPQDFLLFGGTIKENIAYGKPNASLEEIVEAAKKANAHTFIESFPDKYDTLVGERGVKLSGGQRQRIAIARAVLKDPAILILDEATSSLDSESERLVQEALEKLMKGRTSIVIAHRLSTVKAADKIVVIDKGEVAEMGSHEELIKKENGIYRHLSSLQLEWAE